MGSMGIGTYIYSKNKDKGFNLLYRIELWLAILGSFSIPIIFLFHAIYKMNTISSEDAFLRMINRNDLFLYALSDHPIRLFGAISQVVLMAIGILTGMELPALMDESKAEHKILGVSYFASLFSSVLMAIYIIPNMSLMHTGILIGSINLIAFMMIRYHLKKRGFMAYFSTGLILILLWMTPVLNQIQLKFFYNLNADLSPQMVLSKAPSVTRSNSKYQTFDIMQDYKSKKGDFTLYLDGHYQFSTSNEIHYHQIMAHYPMAMTRKVPKNVLLLGGGDAFLLRELLKYEDVQYILNIELDEDMTNFVLNNDKMMKQSQYSLLDKRVVLVHDDAFKFLREDERTWDAIYCDFPFPYNYDLSKLYSVEFYRLVHKHLNPQGFLVLDGPHTLVHNKSNRKDQGDYSTIIGSTITHSGFKSVLQFGNGGKFYFASKLEMPLEAIYDRPAKPLIFLDYLDSKSCAMIQKTIVIPFYDKKTVNSIFQPTLYRFTDPQF